MSSASQPQRQLNIPHGLSVTACPSRFVRHGLSVTVCPSRLVRHGLFVTACPSRPVRHGLSVHLFRKIFKTLKFAVFKMHFLVYFPRHCIVRFYLCLSTACPLWPVRHGLSVHLFRKLLNTPKFPWHNALPEPSHQHASLRCI